LKLPSYKDDEDQEIMLSTSTLPSFVTFDPSSQTFTIKPLSSDQVGSHPITVKLTDSATETKSY